MIYEWSTLPMGKYIDLFRATKLTDDEDEIVLRSAAVLNDISYDEIMNMPMDKAEELIRGVHFLYERPNDVKVKKKYVCGDMVLVPTLKVEKMTTAQYIDYQAICRQTNEMLCEFLAVFLVPEGHKYNDGYDNEEVVEAIRKYISAEEGFAMANFFVRKCRRLIRRTLLYLQAKMTTLRITTRDRKQKEIIRQMEEQMEALNSLLG